MAQIRQYDAPIEDVRPSNAGAEAFAMAGRRIGAFYHQTGEEISGAVKAAGDTVERFAAHAEITHGALGLAGIQADLTQKWNQTVTDPNVDPNDPTIAAKFQRDVVEPALDKFQNGFVTDYGNRWAESRVDELRTHFFTKTAADMSTLAGVAVRTNMEKMANTWSATSYNDPSSAIDAIKSFDASIDATIATSNMNTEGVAAVREAAQKAKEQIAQSALFGLISKNPNVDYSKFASDPAIAPYLKGTDPKQIAQYQQGQQRIAAAYDRQAQADLRREQTEKADDAFNKAVGNNITFDDQGNANFNAQFFKDIKAISMMPGAPPGLLRSGLELGEHMQQEQGKVVDDPFTAKALMSGLLDNELTLESLMQARKEDKIGDGTFKNIYGMMQDMRKDPSETPQFRTFMQGAEQLISPTLPFGGALMKDPDATARLSDYIQRIMPQLLKLSPQERVKEMDFSNPNSLANQAMAPYKRSPADLMKHLLTLYGSPGGTPVSEVKPAQADRFVNGLKVPAPLMDNKNLQSNGTLFRDTVTGKYYDAAGREFQK